MNYHFETLQLHVGQEQPDAASDSRAVPIYQTAGYVFHDADHATARFNLSDAGNIYGRLTNSTQEVLEKRIATLEGGVAGLALSSGSAAIAYTIEALAQAGEHIVAQKSIYGGTKNLLAHTLPRHGIATSFVDIHNLAEVSNAITNHTRAIFIETLGNPNSDIPDIEAIANVADMKSLVIHPATTTHSQLSAQDLAAQMIKPTTIRLSIGTEHIEDIIADLDTGFRSFHYGNFHLSYSAIF